MGEGSCITFPYGSIFGERYIEIGEGTMIGAEASLSAGMAPGQDLGPDAVAQSWRGVHAERAPTPDVPDDR